MKRIVILLLILSLIFTCGCWDNEEIEQRLFVTGVAVDINEEAKEGDINKLLITYSYPNINVIGKTGGSGPNNFTISTTSSGIFQAGTELMGEVPFPFYYRHLKVIILSKKVLEDEKLVRHILDELNRDIKINKRVRVLATPGKAKDVLELAAKEGYRTEGTIYVTIRDNRFTGRYTVKSLTDMIADFDISGVTIVPKITIEGDKFTVAGGCIIKDYKFLDWIDPDKTRVINLIDGNIGTEIIDIMYNGELLSYAIRRSSVKKEISVDDGIVVNLNIRLEGYLQGYSLSEKDQVYNNEILSDIEKTIGRELMKQIEDTNKYLIEKKAPLFGIGEQVSKFHPKLWEKVKDSWDDMMGDVEFKFNIDVVIRGTGITK